MAQHESQGRQGLLSPLLCQWRVAKARSYVKGQMTLDFGCGDGSLAAFCSPDKYVGVDISPAAISSARQRHPDHRFATAIPDHMRYDVIVLLAVLEHIKEPAGFLRDLLGLLNPGGTIVLTTPSPRARRLHEIGAWLGVFSRDAAEEHEEFLSMEKLRQVVHRAGGTVVAYESFMARLNQLVVISRND